jgi:hypothetical protein
MASKSPNYTDVEHMLFRGFLTLPASLGGVPVVFKTLNTFEHECVGLYSSFDDLQDPVKNLQIAYILAHSVFLFNRVNVLQHREGHLSELVEAFLDLPSRVLSRLILNLSFLNQRALTTVDLIRPYSFGTISRQNWISCRGIPLNDPRLTGIQGTEVLGLNIHQKLWTFYNTHEDEEDRHDRLWSLAKFEASVHNPKEIRKIDQKDRDKKREEMSRREAIFFGKGEEVVPTGMNGEVKVSNESVEDLLTQMKRSIEGQKDFHDMVVEQYEQKIKERYEREQRERQAATERSRQSREDFFQNPELRENPFIFLEEGDVIKEVANQRVRRKQMLSSGIYKHDQDFHAHGEHLRKWGVIASEDPDGQEDLFRSHYKTVTEDLEDVE